MTDKHFIHDPQRLVTDALQSIKLANPGVSLDLVNRIVYAPGHSSSTNVAVISGGGSGHEPAFTGFVGRGMLTGAVAGNIFASPSSKQIFAAIDGVRASKGVLITVMRYTGDVLNFGLACEKAKAQQPGRNIKMLVIGDDVGVPRSKMRRVGRRGMAGVVLVQKITGALAEFGHCLEEVYRVGKLTGENMVTLGVSLEKAHVPGKSIRRDSATIMATGEMELGMGIHNEPGCERLSGPSAELSAVVTKMLGQLLDPNDMDRGFLKNTTPDMVLLVNNLGGLSVLEISAVTMEVAKQMKATYEKSLARVYTGTYMTSLNGPGFSITLLNHFETGVKESLLDLLDQHTDTLGWHAPSATLYSGPRQGSAITDVQEVGFTPAPANGTQTGASSILVARLRAGLKSVIEAEPEVTRFDTIVGDGDCGTTMTRGAEAILEALEESPADVVGLLSKIAATVEEAMDGTSGALYSIYMHALVQFFSMQHPQDLDGTNSSTWVEALMYALNALSRYTPARIGDRTVVDALVPFIEKLKLGRSCKEAAFASFEGAEATRRMSASLGRAVYVGMEAEWMGKIPDPGAWALASFLMGISRLE